MYIYIYTTKVYSWLLILQFIERYSAAPVVVVVVVTVVVVVERHVYIVWNPITYMNLLLTPQYTDQLSRRLLHELLDNWSCVIVVDTCLMPAIRPKVFRHWPLIRYYHLH